VKDLADNGNILIAGAKDGERIIALLLPVDIKQRIPDIADDGSETIYDYHAVFAAPWDQPTPGVEITQKDISGNQLTLGAEIYDALSDVAEDEENLIPKLWVNSREIAPVAGDKTGIYRLQDYIYQLFPGRNEITVVVENSLGVRGHHMLVIEGDDAAGYEIAEEPAKIPEHPTYPVVYEIKGLDLPEDQKITLGLASKSVEIGREENGGELDDNSFRSKPFLSVNEPESAKAAQVSAMPADKPIFLAELQDDLQVQLQLSESGPPLEWTTYQSGLELTSPKAVEILETGLRNLTFEIKARGLGDTPQATATLETYRNGVAEADLSAAFQSAYQVAYNALDDDSKNETVTFTVNAVTAKDGFNGLSFDFVASPKTPKFSETYHTFRFDSPDKTGIRVYSADQRRDVVRDGVVGRPQDSYYTVQPNADLSALSEALEKSGCQVVGMIDVNQYFDNAPLKRSFIVRAPSGVVFPAFDRLYEEQGKVRRSQTFTPDGGHGASLANEIGRITGDSALPASAKDALNVQIANSFQLLNSFENFVPKTSTPYIDPGDGSSQPNSWILRGTSLPDDLATNPSAWTVTNTLSDPERVNSLSGIIHLDTTGENTAYYSQTAVNAPWNLSGTRAVSLRFQIEAYDAINGSQGAIQLALGDAIKSWTCQVQSNQLRIGGVDYSLPAAIFPNGLETNRFYTLTALVANGGNESRFSIDGIEIATVTGEAGGLNGIAFGDPGPNIAGKVNVDSLVFDNVELAYTYGIFGADDYADSDELDRIGNILLYLRSAGQPFRTSRVARWIKLLDPRVYEWLLEKYTGKRWDGAVKELHIFTKEDVWFGDPVDVDVDVESEWQGWSGFKDTKISTVLNIDTEETKFWSSDKERNDIQLAGILMSWVYQKNEYKVWLAQEEDIIWGDLNGVILELKHLTQNIDKWAKRAEEIILTGGEIAVSIANEGADWAITINDISQGEYMAAVGFIPFVPSSAGKVFKIFRKGDGQLIESIHQLSSKLGDFPSGKLKFTDSNGLERLLDYDNLFGNVDDAGSVSRLRKLANNEQMSDYGPGLKGGRELLSTFSNSSVTVFKTTEPVKAYRVYKQGGGKESNYLFFEKPMTRSQVEVDYALGVNGTPFQNPYDTWIEVEIPSGQYVYMGYAAPMNGRFKGGGTQFWIEDDVVQSIDWDLPVEKILTQE